MKTDDDIGIAISVGILAIFLSGAIGLSIYNHEQHQKFLQTHGCQEVARGETGRQVRHGKTYSAEVVTTYECADGIRREYE